MRRATRLVLLAGFAALATPAQAAIFVYSAPLTGSQESPPVTTPGTGSTLVTYNDVLHTLRVQASFSGLTTPTTAAHIHVRLDPTLINGGVATQVPSFAGFPLGVTSGVMDNTFDLTMATSWNPAFVTLAGGTLAGAEATLFNALNTGFAYFNVHTTANPGGEIRGDLRLVPEPATWAMMLVGFGAVGWSLRRRRPEGRLAAVHEVPQAVLLR